MAAVAMKAIRLRGLAWLAAGVLLCLVAVPQYRTRLVTIPSAVSILSSDEMAGDKPDGAVRGRATAMLAAALVFVDHPVIGVGPGTFPHYASRYGNPVGFRQLEFGRRAHSLYLELAAELGILGLLCFGAILFVTLRELLRTRMLHLRDRPEVAGLATAYALALIAYLATALFLHLSYIRYFWLVMGLAAAATRLEGVAWRPAEKHVDRRTEPAAEPADA
jgi:O-antigen ligase